ncbi:Sodium/calcium exchanger [Seminavis robusta]|uniref:Sodium/calcium exchanger n=1 Tax=Seminavis robusta TaxID=568900 RepID=A0A9N8DGS0_9STRA|nr:Sodium/calcium exchanger [Seminavis robusta]|eukprot:Sro79_g042880.1 Sodium/calcium exchanger (555) ;mRNA; r:107245-109081
MFPSIEPSDVGVTGLLWLFGSYGYALYSASSLISEGSELLLMIPSMAGLVGGVVLPVLGAVPDGAIILFSGLGSIEEAQESLAVGVGALAGSTIMLLTVTFALAIFGGRVDVDAGGTPNYTSKPKLTPKSSIIDEFMATGVATSKAVKQGGLIMAFTTIPFFLIQLPASFIHTPSEDVSQAEHWWALTGLIICIVGLVAYMKKQLEFSNEGQDQEKRVAAVKKLLLQGKVSLSGALGAAILEPDMHISTENMPEYKNMDADTDANNALPPKVHEYLKEVLLDAFLTYDNNRDGTLDRIEVYRFFRDFHESIKPDEMDSLFKKFDNDKDGAYSFDEFIAMAYTFIMEREHDERTGSETRDAGDQANGEIVKGILAEGEEEEEEVPADFTDLPPDQQQSAIKKRAFFMLAIGTTLVVIFSDPMVDVMQEVAVRIGVPPFYVAFILAPLASNLSEVVASYYYASKKTRKTMSVSLSALEGAAAMNNTFCLSIFMGLIFFRGLAWEYTAETIAILVVEFAVAAIVQKDILTTFHGVLLMLIFPLSIAFVALMEFLGFD